MNDSTDKKEDGRQQSFESFGLLAGGLAHDYNNMLTAMLGNVDLILCEDIPDSVRETANDIKAMMLKAATLVRRMLSCASQTEPQNERIDFNVLVRDIVRIMKRAIPENAAVNVAPAMRVPLVLADTAMFWQVVMNLVINACDALEGRSGIVTVSVSRRDIDEASAALFTADHPVAPGVYVELSVADTGCGMDAALVSRIFEPLFTTKAKGNGLGLPSVAATVNRYGGAMRVESEKGLGTTFRIEIPALLDASGAPVYPEASRVASPAGAAAAAEAAPSASASAAPVRPCVCAAQVAPAKRRPSGEKAGILVVDDDAAIVKLLRIILGKGGYAVFTASNGELGASAYRDNAAAIDLCLIDASMGAGMNGLDLCAAIRAENPTIPLVLMSAYRAKEMSDRMAASGVTTFLAKPFRGGEVLDLCAKFIGRAG